MVGYYTGIEVDHWA